MLQNTTNRGGGACYDRASLSEISALCRSRGLALHLDGARVFNAIVATRQYTPRDLGGWFDTISICLSKGLGCPVGSLLLGSAKFIAQARRIVSALCVCVCVCVCVDQREKEKEGVVLSWFRDSSTPHISLPFPLLPFPPSAR
jgi:hypothetical protein